MEFSKDHFHGLCCSHHIYIASRNFQDFCSVLNLFISHLTWIPSSNEVIALDKTNLMNSVINNSTPSALHICYFSSFCVCITNPTTKENCGNGLRYTKDWLARKTNIVILLPPTSIEKPNLYNRIYLLISCLYTTEIGSRALKLEVPFW